MIRSQLMGTVLLLSGIAAVAGLAGCGKSEANQAAKGKAGGGGPPAALVSLAEVEHRELRPRVTVVGSVTPTAVSVVASGADGIVNDYRVQQGQFVRAGEVLSVLRMKATDLGIQEAEAIMQEREQKWKEMQTSRPEDIEEAHAQMRAADAVRKNAATKLERTRELAAQNAVNTDELDDAIERSQSAEEAYQAAKANYERVKAGPREELREQARMSYEAQKEHVAWLEAEKEKRTTTAPFDGYIVDEHTFVGMWLSKGDPVVTLNYLDTVDVVVNVDQKDIHHVRIGEQAKVRFPGHPLTRIQTTAGQTLVGVVRGEPTGVVELITAGPDEQGRAERIVSVSEGEIVQREEIPWSGEIVAVVPKSEWESGSRGFPVEIRVRNYFDTVESRFDGKTRTSLVPVLKEGMMAEATFEGAPREALLVSKDALVRTTRGINIYVFTPADPQDPSVGKTVQVPVELGASDGTMIQVTPLPSPTTQTLEFGPGTKVVTAGGERLQPVQDNVRRAADVPSAGAPPAGEEKSKQE